MQKMHKTETMQPVPGAAPALPGIALTLAEVARVLNCHIATVRILVETKRLRSFRVGNRHRILPEVLAAFMRGE